SRPKYRRLTLRSSTFGAAAPDGAATDHFALLKNSVTTRSANFTRLFDSSTWPCTRMSWNFSIAVGSITGEVFQIFSRRYRSPAWAGTFGFTAGKNWEIVLTSSAIGACAVHAMPLAIPLVQFCSVSLFSRMYLSVAMKVV